MFCREYCVTRIACFGLPLPVAVYCLSCALLYCLSCAVRGYLRAVTLLNGSGTCRFAFVPDKDDHSQKASCRRGVVMVRAAGIVPVMVTVIAAWITPL